MLSSNNMDVVHVFLHLLLYSNDCLVGIRKFSCYFIVVRPEHWSDCFGLLSCLFALCAFHQFIVVLQEIVLMIISSIVVHLLAFLLLAIAKYHFHFQEVLADVKFGSGLR